MKCRNESSFIGSLARIVLVALPGSVDVHALKPRIEPANSSAFVALQLLEPAEWALTKIRFLDKFGGKPRVMCEILDHFLVLCRRKLVAFFQGLRILAMRKFTRFLRHLVDS